MHDVILKSISTDFPQFQFQISYTTQHTTQPSHGHTHTQQTSPTTHKEHIQITTTLPNPSIIDGKSHKKEVVQKAQYNNTHKSGTCWHSIYGCASKNVNYQKPIHELL